MAAPTSTATAKDPPLFGAGPSRTRRTAKRHAAQLNDAHGGPGFFVEREGESIRRPHAYFAEQSAPGEWYAVLKEMPVGRVEQI